MKEIILYEKPDGAAELFIDGNKITNVLEVHISRDGSNRTTLELKGGVTQSVKVIASENMI